MVRVGVVRGSGDAEEPDSDGVVQRDSEERAAALSPCGGECGEASSSMEGR